MLGVKKKRSNENELNEEDKINFEMMMERLIFLEEQTMIDAALIKQLQETIHQKNEMLNQLQACALGM